MATTSTFLPTNMSQPAEYPTLINNYGEDDYLPDFDLSDYLSFINQSQEDDHSSSSFVPSLSQSPPISQEITSYSQTSFDSMPMEGLKRDKMNEGTRIAFRMKTELEIIDDGFKWRKYGKKMVKNSPNPRNYYKCSSEGCSVKKRVERDGEDSRYVITTYDGVHNHHTPGLTLIYSNDANDGNWTSQLSHGTK